MLAPGHITVSMSFFFLIEFPSFCLTRWRSGIGVQYNSCYEVETDPSSSLAFFVL